MSMGMCFIFVGIYPTMWGLSLHSTHGLNACGWKGHPCLWTNRGRKWGAWFTIIGLKHQFPKIEDFEPKSKLCFLASTTGSSTSIPSTYIVFLTKMQKRQTLRNGFAFIRKRYHNFWSSILISESKVFSGLMNNCWDQMLHQFQLCPTIHLYPNQEQEDSYLLKLH